MKASRFEFLKGYNIDNSWHRGEGCLLECLSSTLCQEDEKEKLKEICKDKHTLLFLELNLHHFLL